MINNQKIRKLAQIASESKSIPKDIAQYVLENLEKKELKVFLNMYKSELEKKTIHVTTAKMLSKDQVNDFANIFKNKTFEFETDTSLGAGFVLRENDYVVDFTIKNYINETIEKLKN